MLRGTLYSLMLSILFVLFVVPVSAEGLYIGDVSKNAIVTIDINDHPSPVTKRVISGATTLLSDNDLFGLYVYNDELFATIDGAKHLVVFDANAEGNVAPKRKITGLGFPSGVSVYGSELFVGDTSAGKGQVKVFDINDSGAAVPKRIISCDFPDITLKQVLTVVIYGSEIFVSDKEKVCVFDVTASSNTRPKRYIKHDTASFNYPYGLDVDGQFVYISDGLNRIMAYPISTDGTAAPTATISGGSTLISIPYGLVVRNGYIYSSQYGSSKINAYKTTDNGDVAPQWQYTSADLSQPVPLASVRNGYVKKSEHQQSGVNLSISRSEANATSDSEMHEIFHAPANFELRSPLAVFEATVDSNGANGVFRFNSTHMNGTVGDVRLLKCYETNGTFKSFGDYAPVADPDTEGAWWLEDDNGNYIDQGTTLTQGANYWVNYVVKDNGIYDEDRTLGSIKDPAALGTQNGGGGGGGCVLNPAAGFGLEWLLFAFAALVGLVSRRRK